MAIKNTPIPGDILFTDRGIYKHYGVYIGHSQVIHFAGPKGHETEAPLVDVVQTSIEEFLRGDDLCIERYPDDFKYKPFNPKVVIDRARSRLGKEKGKYNLADYNCEHFANWCKFGVKFSNQVEQVATTIVKIAKPFLRLLYWVSSSQAKHKVSSVGLEDIICYFKSENRLNLLKTNSDLLPIVFKEQEEEDYSVLSCIFNKQNGDIKNAYLWHADQLEDDLKKAFGDKNMIILQ